jgi:Deoxyinosine 3''endonuclease (endonuclease V)
MITIEEALELQKLLRERIIKEDRLSPVIKTVAGVDVEYDKESDLITGSIVVLDYTTLSVKEAATHTMSVTFPYIPGLFSFRELPPLLEAYKNISVKPDIILCDGQGYAHPRRFGMACHLGLELEAPTIGCAKTRFFGYPESNLNSQRGSTANLLAEDSDEIIGAVLRTQEDTNPVYVSVGHMVSLERAVEIVLHVTTRYRLPETTRYADRYAREGLESFKKANGMKN